MRVRLTQIDGKLPNLALMKLASWHRKKGHEITFTKKVGYDPGLLEPMQTWDRVYGSAIFSRSADRVAELRRHFPDAIVGGTWDITNNRTVEELIGEEHEHYDYSIYDKEVFVLDHGIGRKHEHRSGFDDSIGFTQRGCRLNCGFCVVPKKEGKPRSVNTIAQIWRGGDKPRHLHLLDNDFFGQDEKQWQARVDEIVEGKFKACLNQGINVRMITPESAAAIKRMGYWDDRFKYERLYTAWDNLKDEGRFFKGVEMLEAAGIPPRHLLVYMLIGFDKKETWGRLFHRFKRMADQYILAYPMVYGDRDRTLPIGELGPMKVRDRYPVIENPNDPRLEKRTLGQFQRYVIKRYFTATPFEQFDITEWKQSQTAEVEEDAQVGLFEEKFSKTA
jgi:hypothetical protein